MHFVLSPFGSSGDVNPFLSLGQELARRRHRVTVLANPYFESAVRHLGLDFSPLGTIADFERLAADPRIWNPRAALGFLLREGVAPLMAAHFDQLSALNAREPIHAVTNLFGFGAFVAREKLSIPLTLVHLQPSVLWSDYEQPQLPGLFGPRWLRRRMLAFASRFIVDPLICPDLNRWRHELGLPPVKQLLRWWHSADLIGGLFPTWFAPPQIDWPQPLVQTSFPLWDEQNDEPLPADIQSFLDDGEPPIVFTPGSLNLFGEAFFQGAVDACVRLQRRGILLTRFPKQVPTHLPSDVRYFPYAPFTQLLPKCAALVHHGGVGSMSQAMAAGIPQVLAVLAHDQFDNAHRVQRLGVGDSLAFRRVNGRRLAGMLRRLLESSAVGEACRRVAEALAPRDGIPRLVDAMTAHFHLAAPTNN